jgi:ATP-binding cassette, subfamily B, multidrug efflux pump
MRELRRLLGFVRPYWLKAALALLLLSTLVGLDLAIPRLIQRIIDRGIAQRDQALVVRTALQMLGISALSTLIAIANNAFSVRVGEGVARDLRRALFLHIQRYAFGNLDRQKTGQLLVRLTSDVQAVKLLTQVSLRIGTRAPLLMLGSLCLMVATSPRLALALAPLLVVTVLVIALFIWQLEPLFRAVQRKLDALNNVLQENIAGARLIKALVRADFEQARFGVANAEMTQKSVSVMRRMAALSPALTLCINLGVVVVIWVGGLQSIRGQLSIGQIVAFANYLHTTMAPLLMLTMLSNVWAAGFASLKRIQEVFDTVPEVQDAEQAAGLAPDAPADVVFDHVSFGYPGGGEPVLHDISFVVPAGKTIAILGPTGSGKSTLVDLIPRFYDVGQGSVRVFGRDVRELARDSLLARIGFVAQDAVLFSGTLRDNIRYGRPDASDAEVVQAAAAAQADGFIRKLEQGYDSRVEQRGANLSGGQKQRIAIARALLLDPQILILDDSTSAVDVETEAKIQAALRAVGRARTTFIVAQRISTVLDADLILLLERGRIAAQGTHAELLAGSELYREIYASQLGAAVAAPAARSGGSEVTP